MTLVPEKEPVASAYSIIVKAARFPLVSSLPMQKRLMTAPALILSGRINEK